MMRLPTGEELVGNLRGACRRTPPRRWRLLRSSRERGIAVIAQKDRLSGCDGRSDQARAYRSAVGAATAARVEQAKTITSCKRPPFLIPEIAPAPAAMR